MAHHVTLEQLAARYGLSLEDVYRQCLDLGVPILHGRVDYTLFEAALEERLASPSGSSPTETRADGRAR